jgi:hypothetical protein
MNTGAYKPNKKCLQEKITKKPEEMLHAMKSGA